MRFLITSLLGTCCRMSGLRACADSFLIHVTVCTPSRVEQGEDGLAADFNRTGSWTRSGTRCLLTWTFNEITNSRTCSQNIIVPISQVAAPTLGAKYGNKTKRPRGRRIERIFALIIPSKTGIWDGYERKPNKTVNVKAPQG